MKKICGNCSEHFEIDEADLAFLQRMSPSFGGQTYPIPPPGFCPLCRLQRRLAFRNQLHMYSRKLADGQTLFTMYDEEVPFPVVSNAEWWTDHWNALDYGIDFDFSMSFWSQFERLRNLVPHPARYGSNFENSDFCNNAHNLKNCYLVFHTTDAEDCFYCENVWGSINCIDCTRTPSSELCYDCVECSACYNLQNSQECDNCRDSFFLLNCRSCRDCFGCVNLRHKQNFIFNEKHSKSSYEAFLREANLASYRKREESARDCLQFFRKHPRPNMVSLRVEDVSGNYIFDSKNVHDSYFVREAEDSRYCFNLNRKVTSCYDYALYGNNTELVYESVSGGMYLSRVGFCYQCFDGCSDLLYCSQCAQSSDCFGCVGLKRQKYCVLNKQYSKDDYERLVAKIISHMAGSGEWGEFFPIKLSVIAYDHSMAARYFPMSKEQALSLGLRWGERAEPSAPNAVVAAELPDVAPQNNGSLLARSAKSGRPFLITGKEIQMYRRLGAPLPRRTYDERMEERVRKLGDIREKESLCSKSGRAMRTTFDTDSWIIWNQEEYDREFNS